MFDCCTLANSENEPPWRQENIVMLRKASDGPVHKTVLPVLGLLSNCNKIR